MSLWSNSESPSVMVKDHAVKRMMERGIFKSDILEILHHGEMIENYPSDFPYPSCLMFKVVNDKPLHLVAAYNQKDNEIIIITAYIPDENTFDSDFKTRKKN